MENWNGKPYHSFDYMLKEQFGEKIYKVALDAGMTCPIVTELLAAAAVFFAVQEVQEILQAVVRTLLHSRLKSRQLLFGKSGA